MADEEGQALNNDDDNDSTSSSDSENDESILVEDEVKVTENLDTTKTTLAINRRNAYPDADLLDHQGLRFLSYRWPHLNVGIFGFIVHLTQLLGIIGAFLSLLNMGIPQIPGTWAPATVTAFTFVYLLALIVTAALKPSEREREIETILTDKPANITDDYIRQVNFAKNDLAHFSRGFGIHGMLIIFWWSWFSLILNFNPSITFQGWPEAYISQIGLTLVFLISNLMLFWFHIFTNNVEQEGNVIGHNVKQKPMEDLRKKKKKRRRRKRSRRNRDEIK